jgi:hypothetical protein
VLGQAEWVCPDTLAARANHKVQNNNPTMKFRRPHIVILIILVIVVFGSVLLVATRPKTKADFSHYQTAQELQTYLETKLPVGSIKIKQVEDQLSAEGIIGCHLLKDSPTSDEKGNYKTVDTRIRCSVFAPFEPMPNTSLGESILQRLTVSWDYELDFVFEDNLLTKIRVWKGATGF